MVGSQFRGDFLCWPFSHLWSGNSRDPICNEPIDVRIRVLFGNHEVFLSDTEYRLLSYLARNTASNEPHLAVGIPLV